MAKLGGFKHSKQKDNVSYGVTVLMMILPLLKLSHSREFDDEI